ncbi:aminotransferase class IV [Nostoc ellipsosporum NOK]|nr:aminotransferase class IV [Nostoc ellipsosporum NOK]
MSTFCCLNGRFVRASEPVLLASNRSYRYGDGLFETLRVINGRIQLPEYHFDRLLRGMKLLDYTLPRRFDPDTLEQHILQLAQKNQTTAASRIRLSVFRGNGGLYDEEGPAQYLIESWPLESSIWQWNENGLEIDIYQKIRKSCDTFANLKSASFLCYSMAARYAKQHKLNDCLVLNEFGRIADSSIANVFIIRGTSITTPPLSEGCVDGVVRRYLLQELRSLIMEHGFDLAEQPCTPEELATADGLFLTNAIRGIRWVKQCGQASYNSEMVRELFRITDTSFRPL